MTHPAAASQASRSGAMSHPADSVLGRNLIAVASGKGGVGKTWFAITLSHALAHLGRKVLLFDGDLGLANVDIQLGLTSKGSLMQVLRGEKGFADVVTSDAGTGVDVVPGRSGVASLADADGTSLDQVAHGLALVGQMYDHVILDLGAGVDRAVRHMAGSAGKVLVLTNVEPTAMTDAYALIKLLHQAGAGERIRIVVNGAADKRDGGQTYEKLKTACQNFLGFAPPLAGLVHQDSHVPEAIRRQIPLITRHPTSRAAEDVSAIARSLRV